MSAPNLETKCLCQSTGRYRRSRSGSRRAKRMGRAKQLLEFCGQSLITRAASVALEAGCLAVAEGGAVRNGRGGCGALLYERLLRRPRGSLYSISNEGALITSGVIRKNPAHAQSRRIFSSRIFFGNERYVAQTKTTWNGEKIIWLRLHRLNLD
jgi:hypothetical protein